MDAVCMYPCTFCSIGRSACLWGFCTHDNFIFHCHSLMLPQRKIIRMPGLTVFWMFLCCQPIKQFLWKGDRRVGIVTWKVSQFYLIKEVRLHLKMIRNKDMQHANQVGMYAIIPARFLWNRAGMIALLQWNYVMIGCNKNDFHPTWNTKWLFKERINSIFSIHCLIQNMNH